MNSSEELRVDATNPTWKVNIKERVSACDNRPGLKKIYVKVLDDKGKPLRGVKVRFDTENSQGIAYDHMHIWGLTDGNGYLEWNHLGVPTRYKLWIEDDETPLIENIRTDLGNEYCRPPGAASWSEWRPINRPGIYSYRIEVQRKSSGEVPESQPPIISNVRIEALDDQQDEGYARVIVSFDTDVETEARACYSLYFEGAAPGEDLEPICDPFSVGGWHSDVSEEKLSHRIELSGGSLWYSRESLKRYCLQVIAWRPGQRHWPRGKGYSEKQSFYLPSR